MDEQDDEIQSEQNGNDEDDAPREEVLYVLLALARLDLDAATAYRVCAETVMRPDLRQSLLAFSQDHLRHVDNLNQVIQARGGQPLELDEPGASLLGPLAQTAVALGDDVAIMALLGNEQLTNRSYEVVREIDWDADLRVLIERHMDDEQRHLTWLADREDDAWSSRADLEELGEQDATRPRG